MSLHVLATRPVNAQWRGVALVGPPGSIFEIPDHEREAFVSEFDGGGRGLLPLDTELADRLLAARARAELVATHGGSLGRRIARIIARARVYFESTRREAASRTEAQSRAEREPVEAFERLRGLVVGAVKEKA